MSNHIRKEDDNKMSTFRKWRFSILIGSGIIAAGVLLYFSNARVSSDKTQGAIGKRDVYRDSQVNTADIAAPGQAPVATAAILESSEFKSLAKNPAFQELLQNQSFTALKNDARFSAILADVSFQSMIQNPVFMQAINTGVLAQAVAGVQTNLQAQQAILSAIQQDVHFEALQNNVAFNTLIQSNLFLGLFKSHEFQNLLASQSFNVLASNSTFNSLLSNSEFRQNLLRLSSSQLLMGNSGGNGTGNR